MFIVLPMTNGRTAANEKSGNSLDRGPAWRQPLSIALQLDTRGTVQPTVNNKEAQE